MKILILLCLLLSSLALAQAPRPRLMCRFENGYFKVTDGTQRWEKYIGTSTNPQVDCGSDFAVGAAGPYFVTFWSGQISEKYIGGNGSNSLLRRGHLAVAMYDSYLVVARAGGQILQKYVSGTGVPVIEASSSLAMIIYGSYLLTTDGATIQEKYVGSTTDPVLSVGRGIGGALLGSYLLVYAGGRVQEKYVGSRGGNDMIVAGRRAPLIAAAFGSYFQVFDVQRNSFKETYLGTSGRVEVREEGAYHQAPNGRITRYDLATGQFSSF